MKNISHADLQLHSLVLTSPGTAALTRIIERFAEHLLIYLEKSYKRHLVKQKHLLSEAVYNTLEWYHEHPMMYNPSQGSLKKFLELKSDRSLQEIFAREDYPIHINSIKHVLASHFDNERDVHIAHLLLKNEHGLVHYLDFIDMSMLRFAQVQSEIRRHKKRVQQKLSSIRLIKLVNPITEARVIYLNEPTVRMEAAIGNVR